MKKIILFLLLLLPGSVFCQEELIFINPHRETFFNFPSSYLPGKAITVFLPEEAVPLHKRYPVVYILGAVPKDAAAAEEVLQNSDHKAILVGINLEPQDFAQPSKIAAFFAQELIPYIDTNYATLDEPQYRALAVSGAHTALAVEKLLSLEQRFGRLVWQYPGEQAALPKTDASLRVLVAAGRSETAAMQEILQNKGMIYGPDFVVKLIEKETSVFTVLNLDYLFSPAEELKVKRVSGQVEPRRISIQQKRPAYLSVAVVLKNAMTFDYVPSSLRMAPPYLNWEAASGSLIPLSGAAAGTVKLGVIVDNVPFQTKIKLKK